MKDERKVVQGNMTARPSGGGLEDLARLYDPLAELSPRQRREEAALIAKELWNCSFSSLMTSSRLSERRRKEFLAVAKRRQAGEPLAYILGSQGFYDSVYRVSSDVLIPRPDSECLIDWLLNSFHPHKWLRLLDIGTGSGALALSLAAKRPAWLITATDISAEAIRLARDNARMHGLTARLLRADLFPPDYSRRYDIILSNPPYLTCNERIQRRQLRHEPQKALVGGSDGLAIIRRILEKAPRRLKRGGWLVLEHGWRQHNAVRRLARQLGYVRCLCLYDLAGRQRAMAAQHKRAL